MTDQAPPDPVPPVTAQPDTVGTASPTPQPAASGQLMPLAALRSGRMAQRRIWPQTEFVVLQIPSVVPAAIVPKMSSLGQNVKDQLDPDSPLSYSDQMVRIDTASATVRAYSPSINDLLADDWEVIGE